MSDSSRGQWVVYRENGTSPVYVGVAKEYLRAFERGLASGAGDPREAMRFPRKKDALATGVEAWPDDETVTAVKYADTEKATAAEKRL